jgi:uncharacterized protein (TIGR02145 family)
MKRVFIGGAFILFAAIVYAQNVGIGTPTPVAKLNIVADGSNPAIPGATSSAIFRIGISSNEGIDFGKLPSAPFSAWMQAGYNASSTDPISLQPLGGNVGIGILSPASSAKLDISSTTQGFLPPRMTTAQRNVIPAPVAGLVIFNTSTNSLEFKSSSEWVSLSTAVGVFLPSVVIGTQQWMQKNLEVAFYRNGDPIPQVTDLTVWAALTTGAWCYYNNDPNTGFIYGKLYNWYAVNDARGLAPVGWHIPTDAEWTTLENSLGGASVAGGKIKEPGTTHWATPNTSADNTSGLASLPGGYRDYLGPFSNVGYDCSWWSSTQANTTTAWSRYLFYTSGNINRFNVVKISGFSVRCLRD